MKNRAIPFTISMTLALASSGCTFSRSTAPTTATPTTAAPTDATLVEQVDACQDPPTDSEPGLNIYYGKDGSWSYSFEVDGEPRPIPSTGLCFEVTWERLALNVENENSTEVKFATWLEWNGKMMEPDRRTIQSGGTETLPLAVERSAVGSDTAEWHLAAGDDPVIKITYNFPVKPAKQ